MDRGARTAIEVFKIARDALAPAGLKAIVGAPYGVLQLGLLQARADTAELTEHETNVGP